MVARRRTNGNAIPDPVRVFVGTSAGDDAEACVVLEYTLRKNSSAPVELVWLAATSDSSSPLAGWPTEGWATPWTAYRWAVPALAGWTGRAVYFDCPQVVVGDVAALARTPIPPGATVLLPPHRSGGVRTGVMVWDCAAARHLVPPLDDLRRDPAAHQMLTARARHLGPLAAPLPPGWDVRDVEYSADPAQAVGSVHFANVSLQPHQVYARCRLRAAGREHWFRGTRLPHFCPGMVDLFEREYAAALAAGYSADAYVPYDATTRRGRGIPNLSQKGPDV